MQTFPTFLATFDFDLATVPKPWNRFQSNFTNKCAAEKSENLSAIAFMFWSYLTKILGGLLQFPDVGRVKNKTGRASGPGL